MIRKNRSMMRRATLNPMVIMAGGAVFMALVALVFWPRNTRPKAQQGTLHLQRASVAAPSQTARVQPTPSETTQNTTTSGGLKTFRTTMIGPLSLSFKKGGMETKEATFLSALAARLLIWRVNLRNEIRRGDKIEVVYRPVDTQSLYEIIAMRYKSNKHNRTYAFYRYQEPGRRFAAYYDAEGNEIEQKLRNSPLREYEQITSILKMRPKHKGVDFKAPVGTKLYLPFRSRVVRTTWNFRYNGNCLEVAPLHKPEVRIMFLHLQKIADGVKAGRVLAANTIIGYVGNTGRSTAPHLHYQIMNGRKVIDPFRFHPTYTRPLPEEQRAAFQQHRRQLDLQFPAS